MAKPYTINIVNGTGSEAILNDSYNVAANVSGYDNTSILPQTVDVVEGTDNYAFTISATGILTIHVTETGESSGTPIVGATFVRTDSSGTAYGNPITTDSEGNAVFNNVPFADTNAPLIYYKQTASDGEHEFDNTVKSTSLQASTLTVEVINAIPATRTITLTDANYANLPVDGSITLS